MININYRFKPLFLIKLRNFQKLIQIIDFFFIRKIVNVAIIIKSNFMFFKICIYNKIFIFSDMTKDFNINDNCRLSSSSVSVSLCLLVIMIFLQLKCYQRVKQKSKIKSFFYIKRWNKMPIIERNKIFQKFFDNQTLIANFFPIFFVKIKH